MDYHIFEFTWKNDDQKDWVKNERKDAIYFIMGMTIILSEKLLKSVIFVNFLLNSSTSIR